MELAVCPQCHQAVGCKKIVVFIDGTSMGFGKSNSMMLKLAGLLIKDRVPNNPCPRAKQICRYIAGLGGKLSRKPSFKAWLGQKADIMFAVNFSEQVCDAYRFLCDQYEHGDMIYLFGFSRGAYQVRTLAAMVEEVGLVDDKDDIEEAWSTYVNQSVGSRDRALRFKHQSSHRREDVPIRFVGIWDTVSSIGGTGVKTMPFVSFSDNVEKYRHALALDETRGRFVPEYVDERRYKIQPLQDMRNGPIPRIKEVWFVGSHSNVGGSHSYKPGGAISISGNWMLKEATDAGLQFHESDDPSKWQKPPLDYFGHVKRHAFFWNLFEIAPSPLRDPRRPNQKSYLVPHFWRRRILLPTQKVHLSAYVWCLTSGKTPYEVFEGTTRPVWIPHTIFDIPHAIDASLLDHVWFEECHIDTMYAQIDFPSSEQDLQSFVILSALKVASPATFGFDVPSEPLRQKLDELMTDDVEYHSPGILRLLSVAVAVLVWLHYNSPNPSPAEVAVVDRTLRYLIRFSDLKVQYTSMRIIQFFLSLPSILRHMHYPSMADDIREYVQRPKRVFDRVIPKKSVVLVMMLKDEVLGLLQKMLEHHDAAIDQQPMTEHDRPQEGAQIALPPRIDISEGGQAAEAEQIGDEHTETEEDTSEDADGDMDNGPSGEGEPATSVDVQAGSSLTTSHKMVGAEIRPSLVFLRPQVVNGGNED